ncbi:MAG: protein kinase [Verrucomicrobiota bacterium]|nr:protein kinase [Verrucomicrobiota bacterium]
MAEDQDKIVPSEEKDVGIVTDRIIEIACSKCGCEIDVSELDPFIRVECPDCANVDIVPARLGSFLLLDLIGAGGMGGVYLAKDQALGRNVAIKVMLRSLGEDAAFVENFKREAQAAARLNHPNIAQIYSFGQEKGQPYIVMELVAGHGLDKLMGPGRQLPQEFVTKLGLEIAEGLAAANEVGLIHGDIKPENILFDDKDSAKLVDFGIASFANQKAAAKGSIWGTPYYIAPEKVKRQPVDARADIYSLGATLYHALAGRPPFEGETPINVVKARLIRLPQPLSALRPKIDRHIDRIITRMLETEPSNRYPTYASLIGDIRRTVESVAHQVRPPTIRASQLLASKKSGLTGSAVLPPPLAPIPGRPLGKGARIIFLKKAPADGGTLSDYKTKFTRQPDEQRAADEKSRAPDRKPKKPSSKARFVTMISLFAVALGGVGAWKLRDANRQEIKRRQEELDIRQGVAAVSNKHNEIVGLVTNIRGLAQTAESQFSKASNCVFVALGESVDIPKLLLKAGEGTAGEPKPKAKWTRPPAIAPRVDNGEGPPEGMETREDIERRRLFEQNGRKQLEIKPPASSEERPGATPAEKPSKREDPEIKALAKKTRDAMVKAQDNRAAAETILTAATQRRDACYALAREAAEKRYAVRVSHSSVLMRHVKKYDADIAELRGLQSNSRETLNQAEKSFQRALELHKETVDEREAEKKAREDAERLKKEEEERKEKEADLQAKQQKEQDALNTAKTEALRQLKQHAYQEIVKALTEKSAGFETDEIKAQVKQLIEQYTRLAKMKEWIVERLNADPFNLGWAPGTMQQQDVLGADDGGVRLKNRKALWLEVSVRQMLTFIDHYLGKAKIRQIFDYNISAAIFCYEQGEGKDPAIKKAVEYARRAIEARPDEAPDVKKAMPAAVREALQ